MKILLTGAAGMIGGYCAAELREHGHTIRAFDLRERDIGEAEWMTGDLRDLATLEAAVEGVDAVLHLAAIPTPRPREEWPDIIDVNIRGTYNVMEAMARQGIRRIAFASSACVIGGVCNFRYRPKPPYLPFDEAWEMDADEPYTLSKRVNEQTARMFQLHGFFDTAIALRFWNVRDVRHGGLGTLHVPSLLFSAVHPLDAAQACRLAVEADLPGFHAFAVASKYRYNPDGSRETPEQTRAYLEKDGLAGIELREGFPEGWPNSASCRRLREVLGYEPRF